MISRERWITLTTDLLRQLSDPSFQARVWARGEGPEISSWEETSNLFLDHVNPSGFLERSWQKLGLTEDARDLLLNLARALDGYAPAPDARTEQILRDQRWRCIQDQAAKALASMGK